MKKFIDESWLVLTMGIVFAVMLAGAQTKLSPQIKINEKKALGDAILEVVPLMDPATTPKGHDVDGNAVYECLAADGSLAGWAVEAEGGGFIDKIKIVVGLTPDGSRIVGMKVVSHTETPGLGNKIDTKGTENFYPLQYADKSTAEELVLTKQPPGVPKEIQAITGATYSSQYVLDIVNDVLARVVPKLPKETDSSGGSQ